MEKNPGMIASAATEPFLAQYAVRRLRAADLPGAYCAERHVWVVPAEGGATPIVSAAVGDLLEIQTKTMTNVETDDHVERAPPNSEAFALPLAALLEITTKTDANLESEDVVTRN